MINIRGYYDREKTPIYANMDITYWLIRSYSRRVRDGLKVDGGYL